jgi:hypothetical protein
MELAKQGIFLGQLGFELGLLLFLVGAPLFSRSLSNSPFSSICLVARSSASFFSRA